MGEGDSCGYFGGKMGAPSRPTSRPTITTTAFCAARPHFLPSQPTADPRPAGYLAVAVLPPPWRARCCTSASSKGRLRPSRAVSQCTSSCRITAEFSVTSSMQGTQTLNAFIYLWMRDARVVVSEVSGIITRSDVLGDTMPLIGRDWSHAGVAGLFVYICAERVRDRVLHLARNRECRHHA